MNKLKALTIFLSLSLLALTGYLVKTHIKPYSIISVLGEHDPTYIRYQEHLQKYNDENDVYLLLESNESFLKRSDFSEIVFSVAEKLKQVENLESVTSLGEVEYLKFDGKKTFLKRFFQQNHLSSEALELLKTSPLFQYSYLSPDEKATIVYLSIRKDLQPLEIKQVLKKISEISKSTESRHLNIKTHLLGTEVARDFFVKEIIKSQAAILPLVLLIILLLLYSLFRTWKVCLLSLYVMGISYFCTVCLIIALEGSINPFSSFALLFIFIIATADIVHLFSAVSNTNAHSLNEKFKEASHHIWTPCFICAVTTWIGLLSLVASDTPPIRYFGIYCAFGVALCFFLTFYFIPWFVRVFDIKLVFKPSWIKLESLNVLPFVKRYRHSIVILFVVFMIGFGYLSSQLEAGDNLYRKFIPTHPLTVAAEAFEKYFHFTGSLDLVLTLDPDKKRSDFLNRSIEQKLDHLQNEILGLNNVAHVKSLINYQKYIRGLYPIKNRESSFVEDSDLRGTFDLFDDFEIMKNYFPLSYNETRMTVYLKSMDTKVLLDVQKQIEGVLQKPEYSSYIKTSIEGFSTVRSAIFESIFSGFIKSFLLDFIGIFICFVLFFRSFSWSFLAIIPNVIPLVAIGGLMKIFDMTVDYNLIVLVAIIFGIAVDDTTHFIYYLLKNFRRTRDMPEAISESLEKTSVALVSTTLIFTLTMPVFLLTDILMFSQVALILVLSLILGLAGDMFVLPALLFSRRVSKYMKWSVS